jgi:hypothetical protein
MVLMDITGKLNPPEGAGSQAGRGTQAGKEDQGEEKP